MGKRQPKTLDEVREAINVLPKVVKKIKFKTKNQKRFFKAIENDGNNIVMAHALAGAGKTYVAIQKGLELLFHKSSPIEKLIIMNPTVDVGGEDKLGFLPGDLMEKIEVHNESALYILDKIIGLAETRRLIAQGSPAQIRAHPQVQEVYFGSGKTFEKKVTSDK